MEILFYIYTAIILFFGIFGFLVITYKPNNHGKGD